jgi:hypothetical protein
VGEGMGGRPAYQRSFQATSQNCRSAGFPGPVHSPSVRPYTVLPKRRFHSVLATLLFASHGSACCVRLMQSHERQDSSGSSDSQTEQPMDSMPSLKA